MIVNPYADAVNGWDIEIERRELVGDDTSLAHYFRADMVRFAEYWEERNE